MTSPIEELRAACLMRGVHGIYGIGRIFREMDQNGSRTLDQGELATGLEEFGVSMPSSSVDQLFSYLDREGQGVVMYDDFLEALRPPLPQARIDMINQAFDKLDHKQDGYITIDDLRENYSVKCHPKFESGEMTEEQVLTEFLGSFQHSGTTHHDKVSRQDFTNYYSGVSASIDDDEYFVYMMQQAWKL